jgi:polyphosphate:AMP phosphotransferase
MFEAAELGRTTSKEEFKTLEPALRVGLLTVQYELRDADFPVIVVLGGTDRIGCAEVVNLLHEWMDARYLEARVFERPTDEERERPRFWRYWRALPANGRIGIFHREWTLRTIIDRVSGRISAAELEDRLRHLTNFERSLTDDGAIVLKLWLHLPKKVLAARLRAANRKRQRAWEVTKEDRLVLQHYERVQIVSEQILRRTSIQQALWSVIESADRRYRDATVAQILLGVLTRRLGEPPRTRPLARPPRASEPNPVTVLDRVDLTKAISDGEYEKRLERYWGELSRLSRKAHRKGMGAVVLVEGWDASGKGGVIRRLTKPLHAPTYRVIPIGAPTEEERAHHYLWRFWRHLPRAGHWVIFDRSWYGRVLVERLEGFAAEDEWTRAYSEINDFEEQIVGAGLLLLKFWMHVSPEEQLRRFKQRETVPFKKYKITAEDYRNRDRWNEYELAADEMVQRTSSQYAHWHLVAANDKRYARIFVLKTVARELKQALDRRR